MADNGIKNLAKVDVTKTIDISKVVVFSDLLVNCENVKFVAINTAPYNVFLTRTGNDVSIPGTEPYFQLNGISLIKQSTGKYNVDLSYGDAQELTIESKLIQNESQAQGIASLFEQIYHIKQNTFQIEIFGNPFIQIGDIVNVIYNYGKINVDDTNKTKKYLVIAINHNFDSGGLSTTLKVRALGRK